MKIYITGIYSVNMDLDSKISERMKMPIESMKGKKEEIMKANRKVWNLLKRFCSAGQEWLCARRAGSE